MAFMRTAKEITHHKIHIGFWDGLFFGLGFALAWTIVSGVSSLIAMYISTGVLGGTF